MADATATPAITDAVNQGNVPRIGVFDATMLVMGGIVGAGIFSNPSVVAKLVHSGPLMLLVWAIGGVIALSGAFVYAELAARHPARGGHYAYMRDAFHPAVAFMFGWAILLVVQTGGIAAVAVIFARYFLALVPLPLSESMVAVLALAVLTAINCVNFRAGNFAQSLFMVLKIVAIVGVIGCGVFILTRGTGSPDMRGTMPAHPWAAMGAALTPVMFAYGGWQTASFAAADMRDPARDLSRAMLYGVLGVVALYLAVNAVFLLALGADGLAATVTPAAAIVDRISPNARIGAGVMAGFIALSTFGFLSQGMFATPRVYQAMAADGLFFRAIARISPRTHTPVIAIALQGTLSAIVAASGTYESIMSYVTSVDFMFYGLAAAALFVFRARMRNASVGYSVPGHPWTTAFFMLASWTVVATTIYSDPVHSLIGIGALALGLPIYFVWMRVRGTPERRNAIERGTDPNVGITPDR
ncbi:MAG TPA: amino acid permease [Candidatus Elarobacter sp.]|nr:amino acid permease [Candidatus Elarobacter sp.]